LIIPKSPFIIAFSVLTADQLSKLWVRENLALGESIPREGILRLTHVTNSGIIFGIGMPAAVSLILPLVVVGVALFLYYRYSLFNNSLINAAMGFFFGGSLGNLVDRLFFGHVTDFVDIHWGRFQWPTFNLADMAILLGTLLFIVFIFRLRLRKTPKHG
jgi:signal peptidase II